MDVWSEIKEAAVAQWLIAPSEPGFKAHWYPYESLVVVCVCVCVCVSVCVTDKEGGHENIVNKDVNDLQLKMSDAMDHSKWRQ